MAASADLRVVIQAVDRASQPIAGISRALGGLNSAITAPGRAIGGLVTGLGKIGLAGMGIQALASAARGLGDTLGVGVLNSFEQARAGINAFTKDAGKTEEILAMVRERAAKTPFAFNEMATAAGSLMPVAKSSGMQLEELIKTAEVLAASNPLEGLEGASFSLREAMTGDFTSIIERFNLSRSSINQWKKEGLSSFEIVQKAMQEMGFDSDLVAAKAETLQGRWSTFQDSLDTFKAAAGESLFAGLKEGLTFLQEQFDANQETIMGFAKRISSGIGAAITSVKALFAAFTVDAGAIGIIGDQIEAVFGKDIADKVRPFLEAFMNAIPQIQAFGAAFMDVLGRLGGIVQQALGGDVRGAFDSFIALVSEVGTQLAPILAEWGQAFLEWLEPMIPPLLAQLGQLAGEFFSWLATQVPAIIEQLATWGRAFIEWIGPMIPPFINQLGQIALQLLNWLGQQAPGIIAKLAEWGRAFIEWIGPMIPPFLTELVRINVAAYTWISEQAGILLGRLISEWGPAFIDWVQDVIPQIPGALAGILTAIGNWIISAGGTLLAHGRQLANSFVDGIRQGIAQGEANVRQAGASLSAAAEEGARAESESRSPSLKFAELGRDICEGLAIGIEDNTFSAVDSMQSLIDELTVLAQEAGIGDALIADIRSGLEFLDAAIGTVEAQEQKIEEMRKAERVEKLFHDDPKAIEFRQRLNEVEREALELEERFAPLLDQRREAEERLREVQEAARERLEPLREAVEAARDAGNKKAIEQAEAVLKAEEAAGNAAIKRAREQVKAIDMALKPYEAQSKAIEQREQAIRREQRMWQNQREALELNNDAAMTYEEQLLEVHRATEQAAREGIERIGEGSAALQGAAEAGGAALDTLGTTGSEATYELEKGFDAVDDSARGFQNRIGGVGKAFEKMADKATDALEDVNDEFSETLKKFNVKLPPLKLDNPFRGTDWAAEKGFAHGGILTEPTIGVGLRTGTRYSFAENGPEAFGPAMGGISATININGASDPAATARAVRDELVKLARRNGQSAFAGVA